MNSDWSYSLETLNSGRNWRYFVPCDLEIWWTTLENNRAPLLYYIKFCASFQIHRWSQTWVIVRKRSIWVKIGDFLSCVTLKFHGWPWKTTGHHSFTTLSFVHHFKAMGEFKLELQSGNAQFGSKAAIFCPVWPWNLTDGPENNRALLLCYFRLCASFQSHSVNSNWSYSPETPNLDQNQRYF